ncbi:Zinc finger CCCH domain-containing protein 44 [Dichanthelium oligosanthes]|uniref:Zinc finger CCCH domain-containing protein 44 n=1 Tax=Dichanthelium oligosanthes TaxID=888268 RepID=A0A1E5UYV9_9POAL|nr:Zinc finger CCCH domain-containing protein 44 [Dichanthelium oligosanthes]
MDATRKRGAPEGANGAGGPKRARATAKISVDASLAGGIIGKGGTNTKHISRVTGAKLAIRDNEADPNLKNIELEGTFDQIKHASAMVTELIVRISGSCTFGDRCHFAHGESELRKPAAA